MFEEVNQDISLQRRCAQIRQENRLLKLQPRCPCGLKDFPCDCLEKMHCQGEDLWFEPIFFDER